MAEIKPFRAWRYHSRYRKSIASLTSPLFDVVSSEQREVLYKNPLNSIHLSVPKGENPHDEASSTLQTWKKNQVLIQDQIPAIYVYYQYFYLSEKRHVLCRKGFIGNIRVREWETGDILRHEDTMPHSVQDRIDILDGTQMNVSPTHGLYEDKDFQIERILDESIQSPIYDVTDYQGVRDVFSVIHDVPTIRRITRLMEKKKIILADGHHRLDGSIEYYKLNKNNNPNHNGSEPYNFHLMYFTNTESDDLKILPTHRLLVDVPDDGVSGLIKRLEEDFVIDRIELDELNKRLNSNPWSYGCLTKDENYLITLREANRFNIPWDVPEMMKSLDVTVLHHYIIEKQFKIHQHDQKTARNIKFERSIETCLSAVQAGTASIALIAKEIPVETMKEVCRSGHTLPQKTTFFFPKVITGFVFGSIRNEEFYSNVDSCF